MTPDAQRCVDFIGREPIVSPSDYLCGRRGLTMRWSEPARAILIGHLSRFRIAIVQAGRSALVVRPLWSRYGAFSCGDLRGGHLVWLCRKNIFRNPDLKARQIRTFAEDVSCFAFRELACKFQPPSLRHV